MRKQVQKGRCTKFKLSKCAHICSVYDKVQEAYAHALEEDETVESFKVNVPLSLSTVNDINLPADTFTTDFVITKTNGETTVREAVYRAHLSRPSLCEKLEISRRYWMQLGVNDWGIVIDKEKTDE